MKQVAILGERQAGLIDVADPVAKADWALVKIHVTPMCTEYKSFVGGDKNGFLGHEAVGEVVAIERPGRLNVGDRVVVMPQNACGSCDLCLSGEYIHCTNSYDFAACHASMVGSATYAQYMLKSSWLLPKIPDQVSYEKAALALCALGPSFNAWQQLEVGPYDTVLITGIGPVGFGAIVNAKYRGARVIAVESHPWRVQRAHEMGVEHVLDPIDEATPARIQELTNGVGVDCSLDCSGAVAAQRLCIDATRRKGQVAFVGECWSPLSIVGSNDFIRKGLTIRGCWHYNMADYPKVMNVIEHSPLIDLLVSHVFPMTRIQDAFEMSASGENAKVLLHPWE